jgi:hypothetical protein
MGNREHGIMRKEEEEEEEEEGEGEGGEDFRQRCNSRSFSERKASELPTPRKTVPLQKITFVQLPKFCLL